MFTLLLQLTQIVWVPQTVIKIALVYLVTPWSRVLLEKLIGLQLVKNFSEFYGNRMFTAAFTSARHLYLS
jgi:hypothetical protein